MSYLLDTNAFSDLLRDHPRVQARLAAAPPRPVVISTTVRGEVLYGIQRLADGTKRRDLESRSAQYFAAMPCLPVPPDAAGHYAGIKLGCERQGKTVSDNDLWIAATALATRATLVTRDPDFGCVPGLAIED